MDYSLEMTAKRDVVSTFLSREVFRKLRTSF
jgi:hypothetical protein